ncbi:hypothetical protein [Endozoicomonas sp. 4G]|uniref:hypothetical protein n=1 Tax=Endozoicomonas sp. 4G TaxID=2872754 RepID=UPI002078FEE9|nr:hypothetical protein [Endozoicomonas sp. 4G]
MPEPLPGFQADAEILAVLKNGVFDSDKVLSDFPCWLREQQTLNGFPVEEYPGLFRFQAGVRKKHGGFWRKLFLNPVAFFRDSVFVRKSWKERVRS